MSWKKGRGKLGFLQPLIGQWRAEVPETPMGRVVCIRTYEPILDKKFIKLTAEWDIGDGAKTYTEIAHYGVNREKVPGFWSFTSDGETSYGVQADVADMAEGAMGFEAQMPAGLARFGFWPTDGGFTFAVEAQTKKGWSRMMTHEYVSLG